VMVAGVVGDSIVVLKISGARTEVLPWLKVAFSTAIHDWVVIDSDKEFSLVQCCGKVYGQRWLLEENWGLKWQ